MFIFIKLRFHSRHTESGCCSACSIPFIDSLLRSVKNEKNVHQNFSEPKATSSNDFFCPYNSLKPISCLKWQRKAASLYIEGPGTSKCETNNQLSADCSDRKCGEKMIGFGSRTPMVLAGPGQLTLHPIGLKDTQSGNFFSWETEWYIFTPFMNCFCPCMWFSISIIVYNLCIDKKGSVSWQLEQ